MIRLIISADDLGINTQRNHGIFLSHEHGYTTNASLLVNMPESENALRRAEERELPIGLHLNLTEGTPLSERSSINTIVTTDGYFLGRDGLELALSRGLVDATHLEREIRAQCEWFQEHGGIPTHLDGHHHVHIHPAIVERVIPILDRYFISFVRIPDEPLPPFGYEIDAKRLSFGSVITARARAARSLCTAHGIQSTEHFRGIALGGSATMRNIRHTLSRLGEGTTELMMHPGSPNPVGDAFDQSPQRQTELAILQNEDMRAYLKERNIELISWREMV